MKKLITYSLITASMLAFSGCGGSTPKVIGANKGDVKKTASYPEIYNKYRKNGEFTFGTPAVTCVDLKQKYTYIVDDNEIELYKRSGDIDEYLESDLNIVYNLTDEQIALLDKFESAYSHMEWAKYQQPYYIGVTLKGDDKYDTTARANVNGMSYSFTGYSADEKQALQLMADVMKSYIIDRNLDNVYWTKNRDVEVYCVYNPGLVDSNKNVSVNWWDKERLPKKMKEKVQIVNKLVQEYDKKVKTRVDNKDVDLLMKNPYLKKSGKYIITYSFIPFLPDINTDVIDLYAEMYPEKVLTLSYYCDGGTYKCKREVSKAKKYDYDLLFDEKGFKSNVYILEINDHSDRSYADLNQNQKNRKEYKVVEANGKKIDRKAELTKLLAFKTQDLKIDRTDLELKILKAKKDALDAKRAARKAAYAKRKEAYMKKKKATEAAAAEAKRKQAEIERLKQEVGE